MTARQASPHIRRRSRKGSNFRDKAMTVSQSNESFLLGQFRDFYTEVIRLKELIKNQGGMSPETVALAKSAETENDDTPANLASTGPLPRIDPTMLETLSGSEKITSLAVRGNLDTLPETSAEQTRLTLAVWQSLIALFRRNAVQ